MNNLTIKMLFIAVCVAISSCKNSGSERNGIVSEGEEIVFRHARLLSVTKRGEEIDIVVKNPWDTLSVLSATRLKVPVEKVCVYSSVHAALLSEMGCLNTIKGLCDVQYLTDTTMKDAVSQGKIADLGSSMQPDVERIVDTGAEVLLTSPHEGASTDGKIASTGIPVLACADYMEISPLARAEWIRLYGILMGRESMADSIFNAVEKRYNELKLMARKSPSRPTLLVERPYQGVWHVPCGSSTSGILYADAGAEYIFADLDGAGSQSVGVETILERGMNADFWLIKSFGPLSREELIRDNPALKPIKAELLVCNTMENDFYGETPFHPDLILENLVAIFHPDLGINPKKTYFSRPPTTQQELRPTE